MAGHFNSNGLFKWVHKIIDKTECYKCQCQDNQKEYETAYTAILETFPARDFDTVKQPVGCEVEAGSDQCVRNDFQVNTLIYGLPTFIILSPGLWSDGFKQLFRL